MSQLHLMITSTLIALLLLSSPCYSKNVVSSIPSGDFSHAMKRVEVLDAWIASRASKMACVHGEATCKKMVEVPYAKNIIPNWDDRPLITPPWWLVQSRSQMFPNITLLGGGSQKQVFRGYVQRIKTKDGREEEVPIKVIVKAQTDKKGDELTRRFRLIGSEVHLEMLFLEYLRDQPGIPLLYGGWFDEKNGLLHYVVEDCGETLGNGATNKEDHVRMPQSYLEAIHHNPVAMTKALFKLFHSFAERGGHFLDDFRPQQFTFKKVITKKSTLSKNKVKPLPVGDEEGVDYQMYLIDGPTPIHGELNDFLEQRYLRKFFHHDNPLHCQDNSECRSTRYLHCCCDYPAGSLKEENEIPLNCRDSLGAPESHGQCVPNLNTTTVDGISIGTSSSSTSNDGYLEKHEKEALFGKKERRFLKSEKKSSVKSISLTSESTSSNNICAPITSKTHVFDVAGKHWLLPLLIKYGASVEYSLFLRQLRQAMSKMLSDDPDERPSFKQLLDSIDGWVEESKKKHDQEKAATAAALPNHESSSGKEERKKSKPGKKSESASLLPEKVDIDVGGGKSDEKVGDIDADIGTTTPHHTNHHKPSKIKHEETLEGKEEENNNNHGSSIKGW